MTLPRTLFRCAGALLALSWTFWTVWAQDQAPTPPLTPETAAEVRKLIQELGADSFQAREEATRHLLEAGIGALTELEKAVEHPDPEVRQRVWLVLDKWADEGQVPVLLFQLSSSSAPIRAGAADNLGKLEAKALPALAALELAAKDPEEIVRCSATEALKKIQTTAALKLEVASVFNPIEVDGETVYRIDIANQGTAAVANVRLIASVPEQMSVSQVAGATNHRVDKSVVTWEPLILEANTTQRYEVHVKALKPGEVKFKVEMTADGLNAPFCHEESTTINPPPAK